MLSWYAARTDRTGLKQYLRNKVKMPGAEAGALYALAGSALTAASSLIALVISKIKCRRVIDEDGNAHCLSACSDKPLTAEDLTVDEYTVGDRQVLLLSAKK